MDQFSVQINNGEYALKFMAKYGENKGIFNVFNKVLFWSDKLAFVMYPWMRGVRNLLLRRKNVGRIDNLRLKGKPTFKSVFGEAWDKLPPVMRKHYANCPYTNDRVTVEGVLDVMCAGYIKLFAPVFWLMGGIPPHNEKNVPVTVHFDSDENTKEFRFNRTFHFKTRKPYRFQSRMLQIKGNEVVELMRFGVVWRMNYFWEDGRVKLKHKGYALSVFGHIIPLPLTMLIGEGNAEEIVVDDNTFNMFVNITHPWWGRLYQYKGKFKVIE